MTSRHEEENQSCRCESQKMGLPSSWSANMCTIHIVRPKSDHRTSEEERAGRVASRKGGSWPPLSCYSSSPVSQLSEDNRVISWPGGRRVRKGKKKKQKKKPGFLLRSDETAAVVGLYFLKYNFHVWYWAQIHVLCNFRRENIHKCWIDSRTLVTIGPSNFGEWSKHLLQSSWTTYVREKLCE